MDESFLSFGSFLRASKKVRLWRGPKHGAEHLNESAHAVITHRYGRFSNRLSFGEHFKRCEQSCLLSPATKRHTDLSGKRPHKSAAGHASRTGPLVQRPVVGNVIQQSLSNFGESFFFWHWQTQRLLFRLADLITEDVD
jgi:hypothetical protein